MLVMSKDAITVLPLTEEEVLLLLTNYIYHLNTEAESKTAKIIEKLFNHYDQDEITLVIWAKDNKYWK